MDEPTLILSVSDLHATPAWCDWVVDEVKREGYDAVLFPGDLIDGIPQNLKKELKVVLDMLTALSDLGIPVLLCTGNHDGGAVNMMDGLSDPGLIDHLLINRDQIPAVRLDEEVLEVGGLRIRSIPYIESPPIWKDNDHIWLLHEPPDETPVALDEFGNSMGNFELGNRAIYDPESLPALIIGGHIHHPQNWWANEGHTLFLNSGQDLKAKKGQAPHHFKMKLSGEDLHITHHPSGQSVVRKMNSGGDALGE